MLGGVYSTLGRMHPAIRHYLQNRKQGAMNLPREPMPPLGRMMAFIDGENIVARFEATKAAGRVPYQRVRHKKDVYAWVEHAIDPALNVVLRATYYTYTTGGVESVEQVATEIQSLVFRQYDVIEQQFAQRLGNFLHPQVFAKTKNRSGKGVDIQMTIDVLTNVYQDNLDTVFLMSGDGDYVPLVKESQRMGKRVVVAAFESGLSPALRIAADKFFELESAFFEPLPQPNAA